MGRSRRHCRRVYSSSYRGIYPRIRIISFVGRRRRLITGTRRQRGTDRAMLSPQASASRREPMRRFRVLFLQTEPLAGEVRIRPLLDWLRSQNQIDGYAVVDRDMRISGDVAAHYDAVIIHRNPSTRQMAWLKRTAPRFAYDIDDLLLGGPDVGPRGRRAAESESVAWCLRNAQCITAPSRRLISTLETRLGETLGSRSLLVLNAGAETPPPKKAFARPRLLWVSSAALPASDDILSVCKGIDAALRIIDTDIVLLGRFAPDVLGQFGRYEHISRLSHARYRTLLAQGPFIAAAPLPTDLPPDQQAFFDCKSDLKAAEYGSSRIEAVYAPAPPYIESDLPCCIAPANSAADWQRSILAVAGRFPRGGNELAEHAAFIARRPSVIALRLLAALSRAQSTPERSIAFRARPTPAVFRNIERDFRKLRARLFPRRSARRPDRRDGP